MVIIDLSKLMDLPLLYEQEYEYIGRDGKVRREAEMVLTEHLLEVFVNGQLTMKLVCTPQNLPELLLGRLLTEGIIQKAEDVAEIRVNEEGTQARITLTNQDAKVTEVRKKNSTYVEETPSSCTANHVLNDYFMSEKLPEKIQPIKWEREWIFAMADAMADGMPIHEQTWSTHSAFIATEGKMLFSCEDIGRHNALDKCIGYALREGISLGKCICYTSGRVPTDMVMKIIRAGIPVFASKAAPTKEAVALAKEYNLTLICAARRDRMKLM